MSRLSWWATGAQCHWGHKGDKVTNLQVFPPRGNLRSPPSLIDSRCQEHQEHQFLRIFQSAPRESQASSCEIPQRKGIPDKSLQKKKREKPTLVIGSYLCAPETVHNKKKIRAGISGFCSTKETSVLSRLSTSPETTIASGE